MDNATPQGDGTGNTAPSQAHGRGNPAMHPAYTRETGKQDDLAPAPAEGEPGLAEEKSAIRKVASAINTITGLRYMGRNIVHVKKRASFPLLRQILKDEAAVQRSNVETTQIRSELLNKTLYSQYFLVIFFGAILLWSCLLLTKGALLAVKYGVFYESPLIASIPLIAISSVRVIVGCKVIKRVNKELNERQSKVGSTRRHA
jgi:hypothetical protein|tara:strand:+ start:1091 stop:1696 length:606 start_codon:yes stop_codon:yes gene_type:complete